MFPRHRLEFPFLDYPDAGRLIVRLQLSPRFAGRAWCRAAGGPDLPMACEHRAREISWYRVDLPLPGNGVHYLFKIAEKGRSRWFNKYGLHERRPSGGYFTHIVSPEEIFRTPSWLRSAVFYQIFPERFANGDPANDHPRAHAWRGIPEADNFFGGDLAGIRRHLPYIEELGVNALYLNPVFKAPSNHKYDTADYLEVDPHFGTEEDLSGLVSDCHGRGMRLILDGVFNHTGDQFWAFRDLVARGERSPYREWYFVKKFPASPGERPEYECWWNIGTLPKLNTNCPDVREHLLHVARFWMERCGIDGWRLDVPDEVPHEFWRRFREVVKGVNPDAYITGEIWFDAGPWLRGDQFDGVMNYRFRRHLLDYLVEGKLDGSGLLAALGRDLLDYPEAADFALLLLLGSHDVPRFATLCGGDARLVRLAVALQMTFLGVPMVYYGDEVGMTGGADPGCRGAMEWEPSPEGGDLLEWHRRLIGIRRRCSSLREGRFVPLAARGRAAAFARVTPGEVAVVGVNPGRRRVRLTLPTGEGGWERTGLWRELVGSASVGRLQALELPAGAAQIWVGR